MFKRGVGFTYNVSNLQRTLAFYAENIGFTALNYDANKGQAMLATNSGDCFLGFAEAQSIPPSSTCIAFEV